MNSGPSTVAGLPRGEKFEKSAVGLPSIRSVRASVLPRGVLRDQANSAPRFRTAGWSGLSETHPM
jgi:hypothetical protein